MNGANVGINDLQRTVAAAVEAAFLGSATAVVPHRGSSKTRYRRAAPIARSLVDRVREHPRDPHSVININVPRTETDDRPMPDIKVVDMNTAAGTSAYECRQSPDGRDYFWARGSGMAFDHTRSGSDVEALVSGMATITPLVLDLTARSTLDAWRQRLDRDA